MTRLGPTHFFATRHHLLVSLKMRVASTPTDTLQERCTRFIHLGVSPRVFISNRRPCTALLLPVREQDRPRSMGESANDDELFSAAEIPPARGIPHRGNESAHNPDEGALYHVKFIHGKAV